MEEKHPIENLMMTAMTSLESMIDVNTIVGDMVTTPDGTVIIPVSKVCFGFAAGGSEFNTNKLNKFSENTKLPFGGGSGAGVNIMPMAFLVVKDSTIRLLNVCGNTTVDKIIDLIPEVMTKVENYMDKKLKNKKNNCSQNLENQMQEMEYDDNNSKNGNNNNTVDDLNNLEKEEYVDKNNEEEIDDEDNDNN